MHYYFIQPDYLNFEGITGLRWTRLKICVFSQSDLITDKEADNYIVTR